MENTDYMFMKKIIVWPALLSCLSSYLAYSIFFILASTALSLGEFQLLLPSFLQVLAGSFVLLLAILQKNDLFVEFMHWTV